MFRPFARISYKLLKRRDLNSTEKNIIAYLCGQENLYEKGQIRTTADTIADNVGKCVRWVKECIKRLKTKGIILVKRGRYCIYSIVHKSTPLKNHTLYNGKNDSGRASPDSDMHPYLNEVMRQIPFKHHLSRSIINKWLHDNNGNRAYLCWLIRISLTKSNPIAYFMKGLKKYYAAFLKSADYQAACGLAEFRSMQ